MNRGWRFGIGMVTVALVAGGAAATADGPAAAADKPVAEVADTITHAEAETVDHLKLLVRPLTKEELGEAATHWRDRLKEKVAEIGRVRLAALKGKADPTLEPPPEAAAAIARLQDERTVLADQLRVVLDEWEKKGGDTAEFRTYSTAVSGLEVDVKDTATAVTVLKTWVFSEQGGCAGPGTSSNSCRS